MSIPPTTATSPAPVIILCSCSTSSAIWNAARCVQATYSAHGWKEVLEPVVARYRGKFKRRYFRADAAFANPEVYKFLEVEHYNYAIRLPANQILQQRIGYLLKRPVSPPPSKMRRYYANFRYQSQSWKIPRRVVAKVVRQGRYVIFQMVLVAVPKELFQEILRLIAELRQQPPPAPA